MTVLSAVGDFVFTPEFVTGAIIPIALAVANSFGKRMERRRSAMEKRSEAMEELVMAVAAFRVFMLEDEHRWAVSTRLLDGAAVAAKALEVGMAPEPGRGFGAAASLWFAKHDDRVRAGYGVAAPMERMQHAAFRVAAADSKLAVAADAIVSAAVAAGNRPRSGRRWRALERQTQAFLERA